MSPREAAKKAEARIQKALDEQTTVLDFSDLPLTTLPPALFECSHLTELRCADDEGETKCQISLIPDAIGNLNNLQYLDLDKNPGLKIPKSILSQGTKSILEYLRHRSDKEERHWRSKLVIVGQGGVGKTCLLDALNGKKFNPQSETTHGINIETVPLPHPDEEDVTMQLNAWDFGGQEIYHATHQFFLTDQSLFLFLWNARGDWEQGKPDYWLEMIQARAPEAPIILVATHTDERPADFPFKAYQERFPQIVDSIGFSNKERKNLDKLKSLIQTHAASLPLMGVSWPTTWAKAYDTVCKHKAKHLTAKDYQALLDQFQLNEKEKSTITTHLHNLGAILSYPRDPKLKHIVILNPEWVSTFISKILESKEVERSKGILSTKEMETQWSDLDHNLHEVFLDLMEQYDLSYKIPDDKNNRSLVVEVLPQDRPTNYTTSWEKPFSKETKDRKLSMLYQLDSLQPGIPTWFIARSHRYTTGTHWRRGVILDDKKSQNDGRQHTGLVEANPATSEITIAAQGRAPWHFFAVIREMFEDTLKRYPGLKTNRFIPCPGHNGEPCKYPFSYDNLLRRLDAGKTEAECQESFESFSITELLFGISGPEGNREVIARIDQLEKDNIARDEQGYHELKMLLIDNHKRQFQALQRLEETHCPSMFVLSVTGEKTLFKNKLDLHLLCECPNAIHFARPDTPYTIEQPREWLQRAAPLISTTAQILRYVTPVAGPWVGAANEDMEKLLKNSVDQMKLVTEDLGGAVEHLYRGKRLHDRDDRAEGAELRQLRELLDQCEAAKAESPRWQGLQKVLTPEGQWLWLCDHHAQEVWED